MPAWSMSYDDAAFNLTLIEGARRDADFCDATNPSYSGLWLAWSRDVAGIRAASLRRLRDEAQARGLSASDQERFIDLALV